MNKQLKKFIRMHELVGMVSESNFVDLGMLSTAVSFLRSTISMNEKQFIVYCSKEFLDHFKEIKDEDVFFDVEEYDLYFEYEGNSYAFKVEEGIENALLTVFDSELKHPTSIILKINETTT